MVSDPLTDACYRPGRPWGGLDSPMLIVCPNCATSYQVEPSSLGATGRSVRCVRCQQGLVRLQYRGHGGDRPLPSPGHGRPLAAFRRPAGGHRHGRALAVRCAEPLMDRARPTRSTATTAGRDRSRTRATTTVPAAPMVVDDAPALAPARSRGHAASPRSRPSPRTSKRLPPAGSGGRRRGAGNRAGRSRAGRPRSCCCSPSISA